jgi:hypothetical protein
MEHVQRAREDAGGDDGPQRATEEQWRRAVAAMATKHAKLRRRRWDAYRPERDDDPQVCRTPRARPRLGLSGSRLPLRCRMPAHVRQRGEG